MKLLIIGVILLVLFLGYEYTQIPKQEQCTDNGICIGDYVIPSRSYFSDDRLSLSNEMKNNLTGRVIAISNNYVKVSANNNITTTYQSLLEVHT